jgi:hypothetical protein
MWKTPEPNKSLAKTRTPLWIIPPSIIELGRREICLPGCCLPIL